MHHDLARDGLRAGLLDVLLAGRPVAWVGSASAGGVANLAPYSRLDVIGDDLVRFTSRGRKDTLANVEQTGCFVVHCVPGLMVEKVRATSATLPPDVDEHVVAGLDTVAATRLPLVRVAAAPVALECALVRVVACDEERFAVVGRVLACHVDEHLLDRDGRPDPSLLDLSGGLSDPGSGTRRRRRPGRGNALR